MFPSGVASYQSLASCLQLRCPICYESGVGDPCPTPACVTGLSCQGEWCTQPCTKDADCAGIGAGGGNVLGHRSWCLNSSNGPLCYPGCVVNADCAYFPGTYCRSALSFTGGDVQVCAPVADASTE
jgi:hypothetical protein